MLLPCFGDAFGARRPLALTSMGDRRQSAQALAGAFLAGEWAPEAMGRRGKRAVGDRRHWVTELARVVRQAFPERPADRPRELARFIDACAAFDAAAGDPDRPLQVHVWMGAPTEMGPPPLQPSPPGSSRPRHVRKWVELDTVADLAAWLGVTERHLDWFTDRRSFERTARDERLRHYRRRWLPKGDGSARLLEAPKTELKDLQHQVLRGILDHAPRSGPSAATRWGLSARQAALPHVGRQVVIRCDLESYFASVTVGRAYGVFRWLGYPEPVAHHLAALCTTVTPTAVLRSAPRLTRRSTDPPIRPPTDPPIRPSIRPSSDRPIRPSSDPPGDPGDERRRRMLARLARPHLPQGAPSSPALADLCSFRLDRRLHGLAARFGGRYTRYVDDLVFSGDAELLRGSARLLRLVETIVGDEGYRLHAAKSRVRTAAQRQTVTGLVVNAGLNVARRDYDRLRAVLHDAARSGPVAANRAGHHDFRAHLLGRIAWVGAGSPARTAKLREAFAAIEWPAASPERGGLRTPPRSQGGGRPHGPST